MIEKLNFEDRLILGYPARVRAVKYRDGIGYAFWLGVTWGEDGGYHAAAAQLRSPERYETASDAISAGWDAVYETVRTGATPGKGYLGLTFGMPVRRRAG